MERIIDETVKKLLKRDNKILAIFMHGSSTKSDLSDYSDIDLIILCDKKPERNFYVERANINSKKILISFSYTKYDSDMTPLKYSVGDFAFSIGSVVNLRVLYDKDNLYEKFRSFFTVSNLLKKQNSAFPFYFNVLIDEYYKSKRLFKREDYEGLKFCARHIADKSLKLINYFNTIVINRNLYNNPKDLVIKPKYYDKYFYIAAGLENSKSMRNLYDSCIKLAESTILFIAEQNLAEINDSQFHELLNQIVQEIK